jgi:ribosomal protein L29
MTGKEVRAMRDQEIGDELKRLRAKLFEISSQSVTEKVEDSSKRGQFRRDIARLLTERRARAAKA